MVKWQKHWPVESPVRLGSASEHLHIAIQKSVPI